MSSKFTLLFFLFILSQTTIGQINYPFPEDGAKWKMSYECYDPEGIEYYTKWYEIVGDSIINNHNYKTVNISDQTNYFAFFRVDNEKVYFKLDYTPDTTEYLIFDFSLIEGDTFWYPDDPVSNYIYDGFSIIETLDTIQVFDGSFRKRWKLNPPYNNICGENEYWIEGIGSAYSHPFYLLNCFECSTIFKEFWYKDSLVFENLISSDIEVQKPDFKIFPNPTADILYIENMNHPILYSIFDTNGNQLLRGKTIDDTINVQELNSGIYFLIFENEKILSYFKFVKN